MRITFKNAKHLDWLWSLRTTWTFHDDWNLSTCVEGLFLGQEADGNWKHNTITRCITALGESRAIFESGERVSRCGRCWPARRTMDSAEQRNGVERKKAHVLQVLLRYVGTSRCAVQTRLGPRSGVRERQDECRVWQETAPQAVEEWIGKSEAAVLIGLPITIPPDLSDPDKLHLRDQSCPAKHISMSSAPSSPTSVHKHNLGSVLLQFSLLDPTGNSTDQLELSFWINLIDRIGSFWHISCLFSPDVLSSLEALLGRNEKMPYLRNVFGKTLGGISSLLISIWYFSLFCENHECAKSKFWEKR